MLVLGITRVWYPDYPQSPRKVTEIHFRYLQNYTWNTLHFSIPHRQQRDFLTHLRVKKVLESKFKGESKQVGHGENNEAKWWVFSKTYLPSSLTYSSNPNFSMVEKIPSTLAIWLDMVGQVVYVNVKSSGFYTTTLYYMILSFSFLLRLWQQIPR